MKVKPSYKVLLKSFVDFLHSNETPPTEVSHSILSQVKRDFSPSPSAVFLKISVAHFFSSVVTLYFCPQLGVSPFHDSMGIMHYFMHLGSIGCALACGSFLLGLSTLTSSLLLRPEELIVARKNGLKNLSVLVALSYGLLMLAGGEAEFLHSIFWSIGAISTGYVVLLSLPKGKLLHK